jgi:hypothetical protein
MLERSIHDGRAGVQHVNRKAHAEGTFYLAVNFRNSFVTKGDTRSAEVELRVWGAAK